MSFNASVPAAGDLTVVSQAQIRANFQAINQTFSNNHIPLTGDNPQGQHVVLKFQPQSADPDTAADQVSLYTKLVSSVPAIFFRPEGNATPIQLTYPSISTGDSLTQQYSFIAGPFVIYGGKFTGVTNGQTKILSPTTTLIHVGLTSLTFTGSSVIPINITGSQFDVKFQATVSSVDIYYFAVGI